MLDRVRVPKMPRVTSCASCVPIDRMNDRTTGDPNARSTNPGSARLRSGSGSYAGGGAYSGAASGAGGGSAIFAVSR